MLLFDPFEAAVSAVMLCGVLLIVEGALSLACALYAAMELRALDRMADAAMTATLQALGDLADEEDAPDAPAGEIVYDAESTDVSDGAPPAP